jgi:antitoxin component of RelBE/YafQ-DinJ toxin-antitoxin module
MKTVIQVVVDDRLKKAVEKVAKRQGLSVSALIRHLLTRHLQDQGIDWLEEEAEE